MLNTNRHNNRPFSVKNVKKSSGSSVDLILLAILGIISYIIYSL